uniref:H-2 class II histocompatibility antigen, E-S beta chain-like n=1 Tax=Maylandia zebra TaxID=106582 RepID=A0A3P9DUA1_9CICH
MASSFLCLLFISLSTADGFLEYQVDRCVFNSTELKDIEYISSWYFNKVEDVRFSSSVGEYVGYTESGTDGCMESSEGDVLNSYCFPAPPTVKLHSTTPLSSQHPAMLVCSVYDFYPSKIKVSWHRDGQEVSADVTSTEEMADGDWYYQTHSHLEYTPRSGEKISCVVEHASLKEPLKTDWDPSMPESERNKLAIGASGLILGLILSLAGFIYYKRKSRGQSRNPTHRPVHT